MTTLAGTVAVATTPTLRAAARRSRFWVLAGIGALLVAIAATLLAGAGSGGGTPLAADNAAPAGARALAEVLRQQGAHVTTADTLDEARTLAAASSDPTLFFTDPNGYLTNDQISAMAALAPRTVVVAPGFLLLQTLAPAVGFGGVADSLDGAGDRCDLPAAIRAGSVAPGGKTLSLPADSAERGCFPSGRNSFAVVGATLPATEPDPRCRRRHLQQRRDHGIRSRCPRTGPARGERGPDLVPADPGGCRGHRPAEPRRVDAGLGHTHDPAPRGRLPRRGRVAGQAARTARRREPAGDRARERDDGGQGPPLRPRQRTPPRPRFPAGRHRAAPRGPGRAVQAREPRRRRARGVRPDRARPGRGTLRPRRRGPGHGPGPRRPVRPAPGPGARRDRRERPARGSAGIRHTPATTPGRMDP
ncbi:DUF4350 domain-containing protein [Cryobacterium breve]|uniref:DUF4350 domain-containing protein n=1 Tax=Cryobacterium breve TaxID=1259258 RepID=A0ABY7ND56_9MICO|nr:DUF4350 domain-containing protein [Cryobacterium breve]